MSDPQPPSDAPPETFLSHLFELRTRLVRAIVAVVVVLFCLFPWAKDIYAALAAPLLHALPKGATMIATDVTGTFFVPLKVTLMAAFLLALPYVLWQVWAFVAPGLYHHEKRLAIPVIVSSFVFFLIGMAFAYFVVFPIAFGFFASYTPEGVTMMTDIDKYLSFVLTMFIAFGHHLRGSSRRDRAGAPGHGLAREAALDSLLRYRRGVRRRRHLHAA